MEILPGIHQIDGVNGNCYILAGDGLTLIDTGLPGSGKKIFSYIRDILLRNPDDLKFILLTHYHIDHTGNVAELKQQTGAEVAIHEADADYLAGTKPMPMPKGLTGLVFRGISGMFKPGPVRPDVLIHDQEAIAGLSCVHTPGHTPGSSCFLKRDRRVLFAGDTIIYRNGKIEGPPAQFTPDREQANRSIEKIATFDFETLLSGHGEPLTSAASTRVREFVQQGKK